LKKPKNILVVTYWSLDNALITTYTLPYLRIILRQIPSGSKVWLMTLSTRNFRKSAGYRKAIAELRQEGIHSIDFEYRRFGVKMVLKVPAIVIRLVLLCVREKINFIHAWCTPGGAIGYVLSLLTGRPLILDSFEPHAETMVETGNWRRDSFAYRILFWFEKKQTIRAKHIICAAPGMMEYAQRTYGVDKPEEFVKPACTDLNLFRPAINSARADSNVVCVYAGKFGGIYLEREIFDFFVAAASYWKDKFSVLLLTSHTEAEIMEFCRQSGFDRSLISTHFVPHHEVPQFLASGDFAICPVKPIPTKKYCSPIKDGEYWACGLPVVITANISNDSQIVIDENAGYVLQNTSAKEYLHAATVIDTILKEPGYKERIRKIALKYRNFSIAENIYHIIYA
jgi:glycosyltransferase involved in cell wall biosynthesis